MPTSSPVGDMQVGTATTRSQVCPGLSRPGLQVQELPACDSAFWRGSPCGALWKVACVLRCRAARAGGWHRAPNSGVFFRSSFGT